LRLVKTAAKEAIPVVAEVRHHDIANMGSVLGVREVVVNNVLNLAADAQLVGGRVVVEKVFVGWTRAWASA